MDTIKQFVKKIYNIGFFHIFSASVLNQFISLITNIVIVRMISKNEYGFYSYAYNIISIILIFSDLGTRLARFQYCCETESKEYRAGISAFLLKLGSTSNLLIGLITFVYASLIPLPLKGSRLFLQSLSFFPIMQFVYDQSCYYYRIEKDNKHYARLTNVYTICYCILVILSIRIFGSTGLIIGRYCSIALPIAVAYFWRLKRHAQKIQPEILERTFKIEMIKYGLLVMLTNCVSSVLQYLDTFLVGTIISDEAILADYKIATTIPNALSFVPMACVNLIYPYFVSHQNDHKWVKKNLKKLQMLICLPNLAVSLFGYFFAPFIINTLFGSEYQSAVSVFRVLMITYFVSATFRVLFGNILSMMHQVKASFIISTVSCAINILTDVILIKQVGSIGAAYSTLIITIISSIIAGMYCNKILKN